MNAAAGEALGRPPAVQLRPGVIGILRSATWREAGFFLLIGLVIAAVDASSIIEYSMKGKDTRWVLAGVVLPLLVVPVALGAWLLADRAEAARASRFVRLLIAAACVALIASLVLLPLLDAFGLPINVMEKAADGKFVRIPDWIVQTSVGLDVAFFAGLSYAVLDMSGRHRRVELAVDAERREQAALARELLESRLAAMQAQVEPQFLFDALVDIERLYARDALAAAGHLDRLIRYLRVALPRLRESGSSIQAEIELVESYLSVVQALHDGRPRLRENIDRDSALRTFYPMLLLPLVQRAVRRDAAAPESIDIEVAAGARGTVIVLRIAATDLCADDGELERVRERLKGLYGGRAALACAEPKPGVTEFTLQLPS